MSNTSAKPSFITPDFGNDWLTNMHEVALPDTVGWLPSAPIWWLLAGLLVLKLLHWGWLGYVHWCDNLYRRQALQQLLLLQEADRRVIARELPALIRRVALSAWSRPLVASLSGPAWYRFLSQSSSSAEPPESLQYLCYWPEEKLAELEEEEWQRLLAWSRGWIKRHRRGTL